MIPIVPKHATLHSMISAWARCSLVDVKASRLRGNLASLLSHDFSLGAQAMKLAGEVFKGQISASRIVDEHTHVPLYASLMPPLAALGWREHLLSAPAHRDTWAQGIRRLSMVESPTLRRCPVCVAQDRARYGCAHWRVFHQWPVARHCAEHGTLLETRCARCKLPFTRRNKAVLADDPCAVCGSVRGDAEPYSPPSAYWPLLHHMYDLFTGEAEPCSEITRALALRGIEPAHIGTGKTSARLRDAVKRMLTQWSAGSLDQLATTLGVNWIWFNEAERSGHMREMPPMVSLALMTSDALPDSWSGLGEGWRGQATTGVSEADGISSNTV